MVLRYVLSHCVLRETCLASVDIQEQESNVSAYKLTWFISDRGLITNRTNLLYRTFLVNVPFNAQDLSGFFSPRFFFPSDFKLAL